MAAIKISTLTAKTVPVAADSFVIVDSAATDNKKVSYSDLRSTIFDAETTINESGADVDFRVESATDTHALFIDGTDGDVSIGTNSGTYRLTVSDDGCVSTPVMRIRSTTASDDTALLFNGSSNDFTIGIEGADGSFRIVDGTTLIGSSRFLINTAGDIGIGTSTPATRLEVNGDISFTNNGDGIDFGNSSGGSSTSTLLDDYEEGTWTPEVYGASTAGSATYDTNGQVGTYTKIGNRVYITAWVDVTNHTGTGDMRMNGLPYVPNGGTNEYHALSVRPSTLTIPQAFLHGYIDDNSDLIVFRASSTTGTDSYVQIDTSFSLMVTGFYRV